MKSKRRKQKGEASCQHAESKRHRQKADGQKRAKQPSNKRKAKPGSKKQKAGNAEEQSGNSLDAGKGRKQQEAESNTNEGSPVLCSLRTRTCLDELAGQKA